MTMLEQIAGGIHKELHGLFKLPISDHVFLDAARAAVEAMVTPSEAMIAAYVEAARRPHTATSGNGVTLCYQAMLRAILNERPGTTVR